MKQKINVSGLDLEINIEQKGSQGPALLMVHGIPTNARLWRHVQDHLADRYQTYAMDMVGYGQSSMPLDKFEHSLTNQAEAVRAVIEGLGLKGKVILVGHDHGGGVCQIMASKYCDHISRLVLINPVAWDYWPVLEVEAFNPLVGADDATLQMAMGQAAAGFAGLLRTGSYDKIAFTDKNVKENYLAFWAREPEKLTGFRSLVHICAEPGNAETLGVDHSKITCPTMICWGLHDAWMPAESGRRLKDAIAGPTRFQIIERAGHYVPEDRPDVVAELLDDFVTEWASVSSVTLS
jgi:pimeloyl-ACP methyl ester carboxylesterase